MNQSVVNYAEISNRIALHNAFPCSTIHANVLGLVEVEVFGSSDPLPLAWLTLLLTCITRLYSKNFSIIT